MTVLPALLLVIGLLGQAAPAEAEPADDPAARLRSMKAILSQYDLRSDDSSPVVYRLKADPVLRFTNTVGSSRDGAVFLWIGEHGRPAAAAQVALRNDGVWYHELSSLSEQRLVALSREYGSWSPNRGGVSYNPVPNAPKPAGTPEQRLRQMRALAAEFSVEDEFRRKDWQRLRMLSTPFARYGAPESEVIDGALFAFVVTTDPEALLLIEARQVEAGAEWRYAFAPMTIFALRSFSNGEEVWKVPYRATRRESASPNAPFHVRTSASDP